MRKSDEEEDHRKSSVGGKETNRGSEQRVKRGREAEIKTEGESETKKFI